MGADLTNEQLRLLSAKFVALPPAGKLHVFQTLLGEKAAIIAFTGKGDVYAETLVLLADGEHRPQPFTGDTRINFSPTPAGPLSANDSPAPKS